MQFTESLQFNNRTAIDVNLDVKTTEAIRRLQNTITDKYPLHTLLISIVMIQPMERELVYLINCS